MTEDSTDTARREYDMRRAARGGEAPIQISRWKKRLLVIAAVSAFLAAAAVAGYVWWSLNYVATVKASVYCELVELASDVDARLQKLHVEPGDHVEKGQAVAQLDDSQLLAALDGAKAELAVRRSDLVQHQANFKLIQARTDAQMALAEAAVAIAAAALTRAHAQRDHFQARLPEQIRRAQAERDEAAALHEKLKKGTRPERIEANRARLATSKERREFYKLEVKIAQELAKSGLGSAIEMEQKRTALAVAENELIEAQLALKLSLAGATQEELDASKNALAAREAALALAQAGKRELARLEAEVAMREAELVEAKAGRQQALARRLEVELAAEQTRAAQAEVDKAEAAVAQRQADLSAKTIVSPVSGTVLRTFEHEGEICRKGVPIVFVKDDAKGFWIEGFVNEEDAEYLAAKQRGKVEIVVGSWHFVDATVELVSLCTSSIEREGGAQAMAGPSARGPSPSEQVWVKLRLTGKPKHLLLPGMSARAYVRVR